ncbi:MAG TPA: hypothetical protein VF373_06730, partial [Prolixibacteraceae bacterium]
MKEDQNIDELFRKKLLNYEQEPPAYLLGNILAGVAGARRKRKMIFWKVAGIAAALLLAFIAGWQLNYMNNEKVIQPALVSQKNTPEIKPEMTSKEVDEPAKATIEIRKTQITPEIADQSASGNTMLAVSKINSQE